MRTRSVPSSQLSSRDLRAKSYMGKIDVLIRNHGSVVMVEPRSRAAKAWVKEHVQLEGWQWMGPAFAAEPRYVDTLYLALLDEGFTVESN